MADVVPYGASPEFFQPLWYAAYVRVNHEKTVAAHLRARTVNVFLPLYDAVHQWKDRKAHLQLPLFPGYLFVQIPLCERLRVLEVPGLHHLVGKTHRPTPLEEPQVEALRSGLNQLRIAPHTFLREGLRVRITQGPLRGMEGVLLRKKSKNRVVIALDCIARAFVVDVQAFEVEPAERGLALAERRYPPFIASPAQRSA